jgi:signal transduction histidine kinase/ActR/RegA family two-component response regulator
VRAAVGLLGRGLRRAIFARAAAVVVLAVASLGALAGASVAMQRALEDATDAVLFEQRIADRLVLDVHHQLLDAARYLESPAPATLDSFRVHGYRVYEEVRRYLNRDLSTAERAQVERVRELHEGLEVTAQHAFDLTRRGERDEARARVAEMYRQAGSLRDAVERFVEMRFADRADLRERQHRSLVLSTALTGLTALLLFVPLALLTRMLHARLVAPLEALARATSRVAAGDLGARVDAPGDDEIAAVARGFNEMASTLEGARVELETQNEALEEARRAAERASAAKSEFLSRMSHELRTPLNAILGFAQVMQMEARPGADDEGTRQILRAGRHLLDLIDEVLDISRIEAGRMALALEPVDVLEAADNALELVRPLARQHAALLVTEDAPGLPPARADRRRLVEVVLNFLSNAVKYGGPGGTVTVGAERRGGLVRLRVTDRGPGIDPELLPRLFQPFDRLGAERTEIEGTGIGLALSRGLVEAMGGRVGVDTAPGRGSTFWLELPTAHEEAERAAADGGRAADAAPASGAARPGAWRVLYVEDDPSNVKLVQRVLSMRPGVSLSVATDGESGVEAARGHPPDLVLLDLHLPGMQGDDVLRALAADPRTAGIPVVIVSADAAEAAAGRLAGMGAAAYLTKPLDVPRFLAVLDETLHAAPAPSPTPASAD